LDNEDGCSDICKIEKGWQCDTPTDGNPSECDQDVSPAAVAAAAATQVLAAGSAMSSAAVSALSGSSPGGLFQIINFMQLYMYLILLKIYLPQKIIDYILANSIFNLNFGTLGMDSIPLVDDFLSMFTIDHLDETLHELSVESLSTLYNLFGHLVLLFMTSFLHLIFWMIKCLCPKRKSNNCFVRLIYWIATKVWNLLTFTLYIRTILQISNF